jgi:hypothetical protein
MSTLSLRAVPRSAGVRSRRTLRSRAESNGAPVVPKTTTSTLALDVPAIKQRFIRLAASTDRGVSSGAAIRRE